LAARLKAAKLRHQASVEDIDWRAPRGLDRSLIPPSAKATPPCTCARRGSWTTWPSAGPTAATPALWPSWPG
jgi:hypothetical protein